MFKSLVMSLLVLVSTAVMAAPEVQPVSSTELSTNYVMQSPTIDCNYTWNYADVTRGSEGSFGIFRKAGMQRISTFTCKVAFDNTRQTLPSEVSMWSNQVIVGGVLAKAATCDLHIVKGATAMSTFIFPMTPYYSVQNAAITQYKVSDLSALSSAPAGIMTAGIICDAQDSVNMISVLGLGVKY